MIARDIILKPVVSEKSMEMMQDANTYTFQVDKRANKVEIKRAIEDIFNVEVLKVNTMNVRGKKRRMGRNEGKRPDWKKAMVKLAKGNEIEIFEGL